MIRSAHTLIITLLLASLLTSCNTHTRNWESTPLIKDGSFTKEEPMEETTELGTATVTEIEDTATETRPETEKALDEMDDTPDEPMLSEEEIVETKKEKLAEKLEELDAITEEKMVEAGAATEEIMETLDANEEASERLMDDLSDVAEESPDEALTELDQMLDDLDDILAE